MTDHPLPVEDSAFASIPVIDITPLRDGSDPDGVAAVVLGPSQIDAREFMPPNTGPGNRRSASDSQPFFPLPRFCDHV